MFLIIFLMNAQGEKYNKIKLWKKKKKVHIYLYFTYIAPLMASLRIHKQEKFVVAELFPRSNPNRSSYYVPKFRNVLIFFEKAIVTREEGL